MVRHMAHHLTRRGFLASALYLAALAQKPTRFLIGCLTLPYRDFSFERACEGIARAGCKYIGYGTEQERAVVPPLDASPAEAARIAERARSFGLIPSLLFARTSIQAPDAIPAHLKRIDQAAASRIPYLLTFGSTKAGEYDRWIANLKQLAPRARQAGVTLLIKPHGGNTATGKDCARILADVADDGLKICYDAGNVLDYQKVDPIGDIQTCARDIAAFTIKDHRLTPKDQDCGPGLGEIDHYKLLGAVARSGREMPLLCENIFEPILPRPKTAADIDALARRAREFLETVTNGLALGVY
jgi:sugar phosphate isomerase/epimerase